MRANLHARPRLGGALLLALATCALLPSTAAAKPAVKIKAVDVPNATVESGSPFTLDARLKNRSNKAVRPRVSVQLRSWQGKTGAGPPRAAWRRSRPAALATVDLKVKVPKQLDPGAYDIKVCVRSRGTQVCVTVDVSLIVGPPGPAGPGPAAPRPRRSGRTARPAGTSRSSRRSWT